MHAVVRDMAEGKATGERPEERRGSCSRPRIYPSADFVELIGRCPQRLFYSAKACTVLPPSRAHRFLSTTAPAAACRPSRFVARRPSGGSARIAAEACQDGSLLEDEKSLT